MACGSCNKELVLTSKKETVPLQNEQKDKLPTAVNSKHLTEFRWVGDILDFQLYNINKTKIISITKLGENQYLLRATI